MQLFIHRNWLILAITSLLVMIYLTVFEGFVEGEAYVYLVLTLLFGGIYFLPKFKKK